MIRFLSHALTLAIPAIYFGTFELRDALDRASDARWSSYIASLPPDAPDCARDRSGLACVCADFTRRADAEAYSQAAARATGRLFGLDFDGDGLVCEHLP